jgi:hypothetical protein
MVTIIIFHLTKYHFCFLIDRIVQEKANVITSRRSPSPIDAPKANRSDVREWDKPKFQEEIKSGFLITDEENEPGL